MAGKRLRLAAALACLAPAAAAADASRMLTFSSGTGFFVRRDGMLLTNHHVVSGCRDLTVAGGVPESAAQLVAADAAHDLALLKTAALPLAQAYFNSEKQPLRIRDRVVVVGYPGQSWQTGQTRTREATILSLHGPRGEEQWLEFSDALEGGNSGGPLLDHAGNVVGVVAAKAHLTRPGQAEAREGATAYFDLAISLPVIRRFLEAHGVPYPQGDSGIYQSADQITDAARLFVVNVRCRLEE